MSMTLRLPDLERGVVDYRLVGEPVGPGPEGPLPRVVYAAAHVVADPMRSPEPRTNAVVDWERTLAFRHELWGYGFKIAEAMDTAQRGMGLSWTGAQELIRRSLAEARATPGADLASGAGTDQLDATTASSIADIVRAYEEQFEFIEAQGGRVIMMASRALARAARSSDDYEHVYGRLLDQSRYPVTLHWLGEMFDPDLAGYWGTSSFDDALEIVVRIIEANRHKVEGIKISLLDAEKEVALRARLPEGVLMFTGDDFNYPDLIKGDGARHSHALLGIFDPIAPVAAAALRHLGAGDEAAYDRLMAPTLPLSRTIFEAPTRNYKAGVVFLAWLNGHQSHFTMLDTLQSARGPLHYATVFRQADAAGLFRHPELAVQRMTALMQTFGVASM